MTKAELVQLAGAKADEYRGRGFHCSESVLRALAEVLQVDLGEDLERASTVFRGGGGGFGDRCGAVYGGVMILGLLVSRSGDPAARSCMATLTEEMHRRFAERMGSTLCSAVRPVAQLQWSGDFSCGITYRVGAETAMEVLLERAVLCPDAPSLGLSVLEQPEV